MSEKGNLKVDVNIMGLGYFQGLVSVVSQFIDDERVPLDLKEKLQQEVNQLNKAIKEN